MGFKDFDAARREHVRESVAFALRGHRFECVPVLPALALFELASHGHLGATATIPFLEAIVVDVDGLRDVLESKADPVDMELLVELVGWLVEEYTGRPTQRPAGSPDGLSSTGPTSTVDAPAHPVSSS